MFATLSSFIPSALQPAAHDKIATPPAQEPYGSAASSPTSDPPPPERKSQDMGTDELGVKKKKERANEVCILTPLL